MAVPLDLILLSRLEFMALRMVPGMDFIIWSGP